MNTLNWIFVDHFLMTDERKLVTKRSSGHLHGVLPRTFYVFLIYILVVSQDVSAFKSKILLRDVETLTFQDGSYTDHRRVPPVEQLKCVGGTAAKYKEYRPRAVQCYNTGFDGGGVQWKCNAELSKAVRFGRLDVNCEGYDFPEDKYVLAGSCALRYELDFTREGSFSDSKTSGQFHSVLFSGCIAVVCFLAVAFAVWYCCISIPEFDSVPRVRPTAPPHPDCPPSYDGTMRGDHSSYPGESAYRRPASSTGYGWNVGDGYTNRGHGYGDSTSGASFCPRWQKSYWPGPASDGGSSYLGTGASAFAGSLLGSSLFGSRGGNCPRNCDFDSPRRSSNSSRREERSSSEERDSRVATGYATTSRR